LEQSAKSITIYRPCCLWLGITFKVWSPNNGWKNQTRTSPSPSSPHKTKI